MKKRTMIVNLPYIQEKFHTFNEWIFEGKLPDLPIQLSHAKTFLGSCTYKKRRTRNGDWENYDFKMRFSTRYELTEAEIEDTLIHEMIHYYIGINGWKDQSAHGPLFRKMMNDINTRYGRNITIRHRNAQPAAETASTKKARWHMIAKVNFTDNRCGVKVLPRIVSRILAYYRAFTEHPQTRSVELYLSNNPFFEKYPNSGSLRAYYIDKQELDEQLQGAEPYICNGKQLLRRR